MSNVFLSSADLLNTYTQISGACLRYSASKDEPEICFNPKLHSPPIYNQEILKNSTKVSSKPLTQSAFFDYAEQLKRAGNAICKSAPDIVLVPMRGGVRPWQHLRIYCNISIEKSVLFPYTGQEKFSDDTLEIVASAFLNHLGKERLSIVCIDAAEGGQGSAQLVRILETLHAKDRKSIWEVTLCLFVPQERANATWKHARERTQEPNLKIKVELFPLNTVIGEDMDSAMISPANFGPVRKLTIESEGVDYLIETAELPAVIDQKILEETHFALSTEPFSAVIDIRKWNGNESRK
jgi:hypothetical protein